MCSHLRYLSCLELRQFDNIITAGLSYYKQHNVVSSADNTTKQELLQSEWVTSMKQFMQ